MISRCLSGSAITSIDYRVNDFNELHAFYAVQLGMPVVAHDEGCLSFGFGKDECRLRFHKVPSREYQSGPDHFYWKIGITVLNLHTAVAHLRKRGVQVTEPRQFQDIGYLCHLQDPKGFTIELLQCGFEGNEQPAPAGHAIGAQATLAHLTLRVSAIEDAKSFCEQELGMRLMSVQPVSQYGFSLYFYAWSDESLPEPELTSVANREWIWSRPYTLIELQHLESPDATVQAGIKEAAGFEGFSYRVISGDQRFVSSEQLVAATGHGSCAAN